MYFPGSTGPAGSKNYITDKAHYPSLSKYNATQARANNSTDISSVRPFIVYRFAETYLVAAEAAVKLGNFGDAATLIDVIRTRAAANSAAIPNMTGASTLANVTSGGIDYILDERARELAGEQMRWMDLSRTKKLLTRVPLYNADAAAALQAADASKYFLRPIPQPQIDGSIDPETPNGKYPQNTGW
jgi:starch-binding outer membrane protein, SusD/RagB family